MSGLGKKDEKEMEGVGDEKANVAGTKESNDRDEKSKVAEKGDENKNYKECST